MSNQSSFAVLRSCNSDGKLPLHLALDGLEKDALCPLRMRFIRQLIEVYPEGLFLEITEEIHSFLPSEAFDDSSIFTANEIELKLELPSASSPTASSESEKEEEVSLRFSSFSLEDEFYQLSIEKSVWSPYDKLKASFHQYPEVSFLLLLAMQACLM